MTTYSHEMRVALMVVKEAGAFLKMHFGEEQKVDQESPHDLKLEIDRLAQNLIVARLVEAFPEYAVLGEEAYVGGSDNEGEWIVDPLDGSVNYYYGIPCFCVSIALRCGGVVVLGVIYDPMLDECWSVERGGSAYLNGRVIHCSSRERMAEAVVSMGNEPKAGEDHERSKLVEMATKVRKIRNNGSAALSLAYIATGRFDAYVKGVLSIWDLASGVLLIEASGGQVELTSLRQAGGTDDSGSSDEQFSLIAWNGRIPLLKALAE